MPNLVCKRCGETFFQHRGRPARRCPPCREETAQYGEAHRELRQEIAPFAVGMACVRCGNQIEDDDWELDHRDDGGGYLGPAHKRCNAKAGALKLIQQKERAYRIVKAAEAAGVNLSKFVASEKESIPNGVSVGADRRSGTPPIRDHTAAIPPRADFESGWWEHEPTVSEDERRRLMGEWKAADDRWHEAMREAIRLDDGGGDYDIPVKAASEDLDAAETAYYQAAGVRSRNGRREVWNGSEWRDVGPQSWW